ncbi:hypothetical protein Tco_0257204 [Tanacetum coccineum]
MPRNGKNFQELVTVSSAIVHGHVYIPKSHGKMVRWLYEEIPRNRMRTLRRNLLENIKFLRWVEAKQPMSVKKISFPGMERSGSIVANVPRIVED